MGMGMEMRMRMGMGMGCAHTFCTDVEADLRFHRREANSADTALLLL